MKAGEFRGMDASALRTELDGRRRELLNLRCRVSLGEDMHSHQIRTMKKDIARLMTVLREKDLAAAKGEQA